MMHDLLPLATKAGAALKQRHLTIAVSESSSSGLISAALLAVPGASAYFIGGAVTYTRKAREALLGIPDCVLSGLRPGSAEYELIVARRARARFAADICLVEHGAAGPTGNRYGDPAGRCCVVIVGDTERSTMIETGREDRAENMMAFAAGGLRFLNEYLEA